MAHLRRGVLINVIAVSKSLKQSPFKLSVSSPTHRERASFSHLAALGQSPHIFQYRGMPESHDRRVTRRERWRAGGVACGEEEALPHPEENISRGKGSALFLFLRTTDTGVGRA